MWNLDDEAEAAAAAAAESKPAEPATSKLRRPASRDSAGLSSVPNLRDVASADTTRLRHGVLLRCGTVDFCSAADAATLISQGVRDRIDLRHTREMAVDGLSRWFQGPSRVPRPCSDALRGRSEVRTHHLFVDGRPQFADEAAATAALESAADAARAVEVAAVAATTAPGAEPANLPMVRPWHAGLNSQLTIRRPHGASQTATQHSAELCA